MNWLTPLERPPGVPGWKLTAGQDSSGRIWLPLVVWLGKYRGILLCAADGESIVRRGNNLFVKSDYILGILNEEGDQGVVDQLEKALVKIRAAFNENFSEELCPR